MGNHEDSYALTRHNAGSLVVSQIVENHDQIWHKSPSKRLLWAKKPSYRYCDFYIFGQRFIFVIPHSFMNTSGRCVGAALSHFNLPPFHLVVVYDDLDMSPFKVKSRVGGGTGGHNGIKSVAETLGTTEFKRIKIGIGRGHQAGVVQWVLSQFSSEDLSILKTTVTSQVMERLEQFCHQVRTKT